MRKQELLTLVGTITSFRDHVDDLVLSFRDHVDKRFDTVTARLDQVIADVAFLKVDSHSHREEES
jgi:hypothetical protein